MNKTSLPYYIHIMTTDELKARVLAGIDISPEEAVWLATAATPEALYAAAHEITVRCACKGRPSWKESLPSQIRWTNISLCALRGYSGRTEKILSGQC